MIWAQALGCCAVWLAYGVWLRRGSERLRIRLSRAPRTARVLLGSVGIILSALILLGGLVAMNAIGWFESDRLKPAGLAGVLVLGTLFVHMQVLGAGALVSLMQESETRRRRSASQSNNGNEA